MTPRGWRVVLWPLWAAGWVAGEAGAAVAAGYAYGRHWKDWPRGS